MCRETKINRLFTQESFHTKHAYQPPEVFMYEAALGAELAEELE
jgi:hypothetical protein